MILADELALFRVPKMMTTSSATVVGQVLGGRPVPGASAHTPAREAPAWGIPDDVLRAATLRAPAPWYRSAWLHGQSIWPTAPDDFEGKRAAFQAWVTGAPGAWTAAVLEVLAGPNGWEVDRLLNGHVLGCSFSELLGRAVDAPTTNTSTVRLRQELPPWPDWYTPDLLGFIEVHDGDLAAELDCDISLGPRWITRTLQRRR